MEELFRFNITRPATRSNAATLVLGRNSRQASRDNVATGPNGGLGERLQSIASESPNDWARLVPPSLEFVENYAKWIATPAAQPFQQLLAGLTSLLDALQLLSPDTLAVSNWPSNVDELVDPFEDAPAKTQ